MITDKRLERIENVVANRQAMTVILENVHDPHNIGAVMRTCDSVGIQELYVLYTDERLTKDKYYIGSKSASSAKKWLKVHFFEDTKKCMDAVRQKHDRIFATHLGETSKSLHELNYTGSPAFIFGNEKDGITKEIMQYVDQNIFIPQVGMVQSLNISVACAVTLYEAMRQRISNKAYYQSYDEGNLAHAKLKQEYIAINNQRYEH